LQNIPFCSISLSDSNFNPPPIFGGLILKIPNVFLWLIPPRRDRLPRTRTKIHIFQRSQLFPKGICFLPFLFLKILVFIGVHPNFPNIFIPIFSFHFPVFYPTPLIRNQMSRFQLTKKGLHNICSPKNQKSCGLNARSPELFFGEFGYPLPFRTTGCPAAAAAAALIARCALKVLKMEAGIMNFLFII
jgi:hypothetical protein